MYIKHKQYGTRLYRIWDAMKQRCYNPKFKKRKFYLDKGITVCDEWKNNFISFYNWSIENGYRDDLSIDRIDNDKGYYPENCRWATITQQNNNRSINKKIKYKDNFYSLKELSFKFNIDKRTLDSRLRNGWDLEKALNTPVRKRSVK